jgi:hypothetical protein
MRVLLYSSLELRVIVEDEEPQETGYYWDVCLPINGFWFLTPLLSTRPCIREQVQEASCSLAETLDCFGAHV